VVKKHITAQDISIGKQIEPLKRVFHFPADEYEEFIEEWLDIKKNEYFKIEKTAGAGDMGRDVIAYIESPKKKQDNYKWDCYQCKHYPKPLTPSDVWVEFGKIIYYTFTKEYPIPEKYYFVSPKGIGTRLSSFLNNAEKLKSKLIENWDKYCTDEITKTKRIVLEGEFLTYFNNFDFSIFDKIPPKIVIEEHKQHHNHLLRFGGGLPSRNIVEKIPEVPVEKELRYINQLTLAYNSDTKQEITEISDIRKHDKYNSHFERARKSFYNTEELRNFTRDNLPLEVFDNFQDEVYQCIANTAEEDFDNGFIKVKTVENEAVKTPIESNPLREVCQNIDKKGVCHHLVNEEKITWIKDGK
jgi:hypothetical protein